MQCAKCGAFKELVSDIRACPTCQDGTAAQIEPDVLDSTLIYDVVKTHPGINNRFTPAIGPGVTPPEQAVINARLREKKAIDDAAAKAKEEADVKAAADKKVKDEADAKAKADADTQRAAVSLKTAGSARAASVSKQTKKDEKAADDYGETQV